MASEALHKALTGSRSYPLAGVAAIALREVAVKRMSGAAEPNDAASLLQSLVSGSTWDGPVSAAKALTEAQASSDAVLTRLIPNLSARLGEDWMEDRASFAHVSLVSARLQSLAWHYIGPPEYDLDAPDDRPRILMIVPEGETHTLGGVLAIGALRRDGLDAVALFGEPDEDILAAVTDRFYAVIGLSTSGQGGFERLAPLISGVRDRSPDSKIAIGGPILEFDPDLTDHLRPDLRNPTPVELASVLSRQAQSGRPLKSMGNAGSSG